MFTSDSDFDLGIMSFSGCCSQKRGKDRNLHWNLTRAGMRREKVDPAEKLFNVFAQKVKKGRLWPPAGNEVEKVVSNLHFSNPPDFFRSIWFFSDPPDFFPTHLFFFPTHLIFFWPPWLPTTSPLGQLAKPTAQVKEVTPYHQLLNRCNYLYVGCFESPWMCPLKTVTARSTVARGGLANYCEENWAVFTAR